MTSTKLCVVTTQQLRKIVHRSEKCGLSRLPNAAFWNEIDRDGKHVLNRFQLPGEFRFVRTLAFCKLKNRTSPAEVWIDLANEDWQQLPKEAHE